jgi:hypothetical protein
MSWVSVNMSTEKVNMSLEPVNMYWKYVCMYGPIGMSGYTFSMSSEH